jgi:tRNA G18 (ribose-2'-O)-methylase SpoU
MRLFLRRRLIAVVCVAFFHLTAAFVGTSSRITNHCHAARCSDASDDADANDSDVVLGFGLDAALRRLGLTPAQEAVVCERLEKVGGAKTNLHNNHNIEGNLSWLEARLGLGVEQLGALVVGFPPVLGLELETNLKPTVSFFSHALSGGGNKNDIDNGDENENNNKDLDRLVRLAKFLCESPSLLEYNVAKRLDPRLARVREALDVALVDEESLRAIATKTDSKFETWLNNEMMMMSGNGGGDGNNLESSHNGDNHCDHDDVDIENNSRRNDGPSAYVVVSNLQSGGNIGNIVRSASIFGCEECLVVGQKRYRLTGDHGARLDLPRRHMWSHSDARTYLHEKGVRIYGIEIMADAAPIMRYDRDTGVVRFPFDRQWQGAAFIFGNEGQGLSAKQREICDEFLFIPQTRGTTTAGGGSASLNVASAATVILQAYCMWAGYSDAPREGEKFLATSSGDRQINIPQLFET